MTTTAPGITRPVEHERALQNGVVSDAGEFIDAALQYEASWGGGRQFDGMSSYGSSVGAIRGTIRNAERRYPALGHDELTALASELWHEPVFERRLAAIVLLQHRVGELLVTDLTRIEGFVRTTGAAELIDPLVDDVIRPLLDRLDGRDRARADAVTSRWSSDPDDSLRYAVRRLAI